MTDHGARAPEVDDLLRAVARRAGETYLVQATARGFTVRHRRPAPSTGSGHGTHEAVVVCDPARMTFTLEDRVRSAEAPRGQGRSSFSGVRGRTSVAADVTTYGRRPDGTWGRLGRARRASSRLHEVVRVPAAELGWCERAPASVVVGKVAAAVALGGIAVGAVVVAVLALAGALPG